ncbi:VOC family protein [Parasphingorhabdus pacifica]
MTTGRSSTGSSADETHANTLSAYVVVREASRAIDWYVRVFGARRRGKPYLMDDGRIGHAELAIGDSVLMLADEAPEIGMLSPRSRGGASVGLHLQVADVDSVVREACEQGAAQVGAVRDESYGRVARIDDPFGHRWLLLTPPGPLPVDRPRRSAPGEVSYVTLLVRDGEMAKEFYGQVLGWRFAQGPSPGGWEVENVSPMTGVGLARRNEVVLCFRVDDLERAVRCTRELGGEADPVQRKPYGRLVDCMDNQGKRFFLWSDVET